MKYFCCFSKLHFEFLRSRIFLLIFLNYIKITKIDFVEKNVSFLCNKSTIFLYDSAKLDWGIFFV